MTIRGLARNGKGRVLSEVVAGINPRPAGRRTGSEWALANLEASILAQVEAELKRKEPRLDRLMKLHAWLTKLMKAANSALAEETKANGGVAPTDVDDRGVGDAGERLMGALADGDDDPGDEPAD